ncbi:MAG TPA: hypothetical protein VG328_18710 [Stellaceae bacterium]|jgi:hypothetical protein|nr:hypothetical protein [Stellaceae bacterium]
MSLASNVDLHLPLPTKKPKFAAAEIMAGFVILAVVVGLTTVAVLNSPIALP